MDKILKYLNDFESYIEINKCPEQTDSRNALKNDLYNIYIDTLTSFRDGNRRDHEVFNLIFNLHS